MSHTIPLPLAPTASDINAKVAELEKQAQARLIELGNRDPVWANMQGQILALLWTITPQPDSPEA